MIDFMLSLSAFAFFKTIIYISALATSYKTQWILSISLGFPCAIPFLKSANILPASLAEGNCM